MIGRSCRGPFNCMSIAMKRYTASEPIAPRSHDPDQLRVLPAQDRRAARAARPYRGPAEGAVAGIRLVHVWCRRLDPGLHARDRGAPARDARAGRSEENTSELQPLMRIE